MIEITEFSHNFLVNMTVSELGEILKKPYLKHWGTRNRDNLFDTLTNFLYYSG